MAGNAGPPEVPLPSVDDLKKIDSYLGDIGTKLDNISRVNSSWADQMSKSKSRAIDIAGKMNAIGKAAQQAGGYTAQQVKDIQNLNSQLAKTQSAWRNIAKYMATLSLDGLEKFTRGVTTASLKFFEVGLKGVYDGIKRVYEYQEKWANAIGKMNLNIGALSPNMQGFRKEAMRWEGSIRGLTDQFGEGLQMAQDFVTGFGRILPDKELAKWGKLGLGIARGLGLGGDAAGTFLKSMYQLGQSTEETGDTVQNIVAGAKTAGVSVNAFSKEVNESRDYLISFGKAGQKVFLQSAAFAKKLGVSLKSLQAFGDITDNFESAVQAAAKLNTVFGTSINALDTVLEDDPGKRLEDFRQQFIAQGKTVESLSRRELKLISETMGMTVEETEGVLKSGQSLEEFQEKQEKEKKKQAKTEKLLRDATAKTAQTLFAFGAQFDKITVKIMKVIKPFTDLIGLTRKGGKESKSFGGVMKDVFGKVELFLDKLANNPEWILFMEKMAAKTKEVFTWIGKLVTSNDTQEWIGKIVKSAGELFKTFESIVTKIKDVLSSEFVKSSFEFILKHIVGITEAFAGLKLAIGAINIASKFKEAAGLMSTLGKIAAPGGGGALPAPASPGIVSKAAQMGGGGLGGIAKVAGGVAAAGSAGFAVGSAVDEAFGYLRKDKKKLSDLAGEGFAGTGIGKSIADFFGLSGAKAGNSEPAKAKSQQEDAVRLNQIRIEKGREAEKIVEESLKKRLKKEDDNQRELFKMRLREIAVGKASEMGYQGDIAKDFEEVLTKAGEASSAELGKLTNKFFGEKGLLKSVPKMAAGGIVSHPTLAMVGEAGPEMVVPMRATATAELRSPANLSRRSSGGSPASSAARASGGGASKQEFKLVAGDVYLDSKLVGRHLVRELLTQEQ